MASESRKEAAAVVDTGRRADTRYVAATVPKIKGVKLSPGDAVGLLNVSASGVLVEGKTRFVPGTRVTVVFDGPVTPKQIKGRVVRCQVSAIASGGALQYQSGIAFEGRVALPVDEPADAPAAEFAAAPAAAPSAPAPARVRNRW